MLELRSYTAKQFTNFLDSVSDLWNLEEFYDFGYEINKPLKLDAETEDVVAILKRR